MPPFAVMAFWIYRIERKKERHQWKSEAVVPNPVLGDVQTVHSSQHTWTRYTVWCKFEWSKSLGLPEDWVRI